MTSFLNIYRYSPTTEIVREHKLSFAELDNIPYVNENKDAFDHKTSERDEQLIADRFILGTDTVLELGGRYGTVSCIINNKLDDPYKHVVIEPEESVIPGLLENRKTHNSYFTVYRNVISDKPKSIVCAGYGTYTVDATSTDDEKNMAPIIKLQDIIDYHKCNFTVLVADCEGCLEEFINDNLDFIKQLRLITYEQDNQALSNYKNVADTLQKMGFTCIIDAFHSVWSK